MNKNEFPTTPPRVLAKYFANIITKYVDSKFKDFEKNFEPKTPTEYITRLEVAKMFKIDKSSVHNWTKKGILQAYQIGGRVYYKRAEIEKAIVKLKQ